MKSQTPDVVWPESHAKLTKRIARARATLAKAQTALDACRKQAKIRCCNCHAEYPIATQTYIQTYWYTPPRGCTEGDYWNTGEANWKCPNCGFMNRFDAVKDKYTTIPNDFYRPELVALQGFFAKTHDCECDYRRVCDNCRKAGMK